MYTEAEAKTKWCPHVRYLATFRHPETDKLETAGSYNRAAASRELCPTNCLASECMMWRWEITKTVHGPQSGNVGYCGLAGKPW